MKTFSLFFHRAIIILFTAATAVALASRLFEPWKDGRFFAVALVLLTGLIAGWGLSLLMERYLLPPGARLYSWMILSVLLGLVIWCFRPILVTIPWQNIQVEILNSKNAQSQGYVVNIVGAKGWNGEVLALEDLVKSQGWGKSEDIVTGSRGSEALTFPGHLKSRGEVEIDFKAGENGGIAKITTGYKEQVIDLYASSENIVSVKVGTDFVSPLYLVLLYACDILSISLGCLAVLILAFWIAKKIEGKSTLPDQILIWSTYLYLAIPLVLFAIGWLKVFFAIIFIAAIGFGLWKAVPDFEYRVEDHTESLKFFLISLLVAAVWVYFSGIGGYTYQNWDFVARNAIFRDLINHHWPVIYDYRQVPEYRSIFGETAALIYYFAYWLPAALVGKVFGWIAANNMLYIWTVFGIAICFQLAARFTRIRKIWILLIFVFWSGMDILGEAGMLALTSNPPFLSVLKILQSSDMEWWTGQAFLFQYSSLTTQLFYVFNQALPAWIITLLIFNQQKNRSIIFTSALIFLFAPLPAIGLAPFVIYKIFEDIHWGSAKSVTAQVIGCIKDVLTIQNVFSGSIIFITAFLFFTANVISGQLHGLNWELLPPSISTGKFIYIYILFCLVEFIPFVILARDATHRALLIFIVAILLILPLYKYGKYNDFAMRISIPALLILYLLFVKKINKHFTSPPSFEKGIYSAMIIVVLLFSAMTPLHDFLRSRDMLESGYPSFMDDWRTFDKVRNDPDKKDSTANFVAGNPSDKLFFMTIGK